MRVLIVEDDKQIGQYLKQGLKESGYVSDQVIDAEEGFCAARSINYDLVIVDLMLPVISGFDFIKGIREMDLDMPILILSAKQSVSDKVQGLQLGADDYLTKPFSFQELIARVKALLRRYNKEPDDHIYHFSDIELKLLQREVLVSGEPISLQPKEFLLLELFMRNIGKVLTKTIIMESIWNFDFNPNTNIVDVLICRLRKKIEEKKGKRLIHTIKGVGYILKEE